MDTLHPGPLTVPVIYGTGMDAVPCFCYITPVELLSGSVNIGCFTRVVLNPGFLHSLENA